MPAEKAGPLQRYAATIQSQRGDYNGKVLSIRQDDLRTLAVIYDQSPSVLTEQLISWGVLGADARRAVARGRLSASRARRRRQQPAPPGADSRDIGRRGRCDLAGSHRPRRLC